jgi:cell division protein FtsL
MSIRMIARDLYALECQVDDLEKRISSEKPEIQDALKDELRKLKAERDRMRKVLEGAKEPPAF